MFPTAAMPAGAAEAPCSVWFQLCCGVQAVCCALLGSAGSELHSLPHSMEYLWGFLWAALAAAEFSPAHKPAVQGCLHSSNAPGTGLHLSEASFPSLGPALSLEQCFPHSAPFITHGSGQRPTSTLYSINAVQGCQGSSQGCARPGNAAGFCSHLLIIVWLSVTKFCCFVVPSSNSHFTASRSLWEFKS